MNEIKVGLKELARYLHSHHGTKVYLLIDEFDAVYSSAIHDMKAKMAQTEKKYYFVAINGFLADMLTDLVKGNHNVSLLESHMLGSYVTCLEFFLVLNNFTILRFLDSMKVS